MDVTEISLAFYETTPGAISPLLKHLTILLRDNKFASLRIRDLNGGTRTILATQGMTAVDLVHALIDAAETVAA